MKKSNLFICALMCCMLLYTNLTAQIRVVCIGNSITAGYKLSDPSTQAWPAQLASKLGSGYSVLNCGVSGTTMLKISSSPYWNTTSFTDAKNYDPQIVIISLGTNDANVANWNESQFYVDYIAMINAFRANGKNPVFYLCCPPPVFGDQNQNGVIETIIIPFLKTTCVSQGATLIDYHTPLISLKSLFPDLLHPNAQGAAIMGQTAYNAINGCQQLITPYISVNSTTATQTTSATLTVGDAITISPQPLDGTWTWTGPNGYTSTVREVVLSSIQLNQGGVYTATYTSTSGCRSVINFLVTIAGCIPATLTPYYQINNGSWLSTTSASVNAGGTITFGPKSTGTGSWTWTGPNGFYANARQFSINSIMNTQAGNYTATFTNSTGCITTKVFTVAVTGVFVCPAIIPYIAVNNVWSVVDTKSVKLGDNVSFGPQPTDGGDWSWIGPSGFSASTREVAINNIKTTQAGNYIATYTNINSGCTSTDIFHITVDDVSSVNSIEENKSKLQLYPNPVTDIVTIKSVPTNTSISISDLSGRVLLEMKSSNESENISINISNLKAGIYFVKVGMVNSKILKLIKH